MNKPQPNLQDAFLNQVRKESIPVTIYLINGYQMKGLVKGFDNFTVVLENDGRQDMIYKHAISTITPSRAISFVFSEAARRETATQDDSPAS
ncbi:MAG: RNA chaperone Hfq [Firmicutes bacterium]|nr:RNA chaperone Hfq [Bacillota bacterium]